MCTVGTQYTCTHVSHGYAHTHPHRQYHPNPRLQCFFQSGSQVGFCGSIWLVWQVAMLWKCHACSPKPWGLPMFAACLSYMHCCFTAPVPSGGIQTGSKCYSVCCKNRDGERSRWNISKSASSPIESHRVSTSPIPNFCEDAGVNICQLDLVQVAYKHVQEGLLLWQVLRLCHS